MQQRIASLAAPYLNVQGSSWIVGNSGNHELSVCSWMSTACHSTGGFARWRAMTARQCSRTCGPDALRYFLLREMTFGQDAHFSDEAFLTRFNADPEIQQLLAELDREQAPRRSSFEEVRKHTFDVVALRKRGYAYERLDQLTMELLLGVR